MRRATVSDVMTRKVVTVQLDTPFTEIVRVLTEQRVSGVPVMHPAGRVIGVISESDLLTKERFKSVQAPVVHRFEGRGRQRERDKAEAINAAGLMSAPALTVPQDTPVIEASRLMAIHHRNRLPVVDRGGRLVGIVTRGDLLRVFLRPDEEIRNEVIREVLQRCLWQDTDQLKVEVHDGVVQLSGTLDQDDLIPLALRLTSAVEGVARVIDDLDRIGDEQPGLRRHK